VQDLDSIRPVDLVISGWPCQGLSQVGTGQGLSNPRSGLFSKLIRMLQYLQISQLHSCAYVLENVRHLGNFQLVVSTAWQKIKAWIGEPLHVDVTAVNSCAHRFWWLWTNLVPLEVLHSTYQFIL
jgi:site-specific DNA-cytosine methylase